MGSNKNSKDDSSGLLGGENLFILGRKIHNQKDLAAGRENFHQLLMDDSQFNGSGETIAIDLVGLGIWGNFPSFHKKR